MKKYIFLFCLIISSPFIFAESPIKFASSTPAEGASINSIKDIILNFDLSDVITENPLVPVTDWGIYSLMNSTKCAALYEEDNTNPIATAYRNNSATYKDETGKTTFEFSFTNEVYLEAKKKYTLKIPPKCYCATTAAQKYTKTVLNSEIVITFTGAETAGPTNVILDSYLPQNDQPLEILDHVFVKFSYNDYNMAIKDGAQASLYDGETFIKSADLTVNAQNKATIDIDFGNEKLYNLHNYNIVIPENSIYPVDEAQLPLTDKGNKEITLIYTGASYKYDITAGRISPAKNSEISYLSTVTIPLKFPDGYGSRGNGNSNTQTILYKGTKEDGTIIGTYTNKTDITNLIVPIWKFDLEPNTTYTLVFAAKQILPDMLNGTSHPLRDTTNPEIVITYTTPATLNPVAKINIKSTEPADNAEIEKIENISLTFAPYSFDNDNYYPQITDTEMSATLYEVTENTEQELQQVKLTLANEEGIYRAKGTVGRNLYEGKTYKLRIPAGYFHPSLENLATVAANDELTLTFTGKASHFGLEAKSSIPANANMANIGIAAFYFGDAVTPKKDAKVALYEDENKTALKEAAVFAANGAIYADFCTDAVPYATEAGKAYRLELSQGAVTSDADREMQNSAVSVAFNGAAITEYIKIDYITENTTTQTKVTKGNTASYTFSLKANWEIASLMFNDIEVKEDISANMYTTPALDADATLKVTLNYVGSTYTEGPGTGVITPDGTSLKTYSSDGNVVIEGLTANIDVVTVYSLGGAVLQHFTATNKAATIKLPADTYYLVKVNEIMMKIFNK